MSSLLNSIFFINKENLNFGTVLDVLRSFMLTKINQAAIFLSSNIITPSQIVRIEDLKTETNAVIENVEYQLIEDVAEEPPAIVNVIKKELISPKQSDTLFWCLFVIHFGYDEYIEVDRNYGVKELEIKKLVGEHISANPYKIKNSNIKFTKASVQEVLSELLTSQRDTSINCLVALLVYYNFNVIMVNSSKLLMLEFIADRDAEFPTYVLHKDAYGKYSVDIDPITKEDVIEMKSKMICLESYLRPLKPITNYKVDELEDFAKKIGIYDTNKKQKKTELYQEIIDACQWL
jgi:hypothetical protein